MEFDPFTAGASIIGAGFGAYGARKAAKQQEKAARGAYGVENAQRGQQRVDQAPYRQLGAGAANQLAGLLGIGGVSGYDDRVVGSGQLKPSEIVNMLQRGYSVDDVLGVGTLRQDMLGSADTRWLQEQSGLSPEDIGRLSSGTYSSMGGGTGGATAGGAPDYSSFMNSPGVQFQLAMGSQARERSASARGGLNSGNTLAELEEFGQGVAGQRYDTHVNQLMGLMSGGQNATNNLVAADQNSTGARADSLNNIGNARASGVVGQSNALADMFGNIGAIGSDWWQNRKPQSGAKTNGLMAMNYGGQRFGGYA